MLDDTCYFLGFERYQDALLTVALLGNSLIMQFLESVVFQDAKRPYTKEVLMRVNLARAAAQISFSEVEARWHSKEYRPQPFVTEADYEQYRHWLTVLSYELAGPQLSLAMF
jgi:hypothetical protein